MTFLLQEKEALPQMRRQQPAAKRNHAAEEIAQPTPAPLQEAWQGNSKPPQARSETGPPQIEPASSRPEPQSSSQSLGRDPGHPSAQPAIHESAVNAAIAPGSTYQTLPRAYVWQGDPGLMQERPQDAFPPLPGFMHQGGRALAVGWQQHQQQPQAAPIQDPAWEAASSAANDFVRFDASRAVPATPREPHAFRADQPGPNNIHNNTLRGSSSAAVVENLPSQPEAGVLPTTTQQAHPKGTPGHGGLRSCTGSFRQQQQMQSPHSTAGGSSWFTNPTFSHPGSNGGPPTPSSHFIQPHSGPLSNHAGQQPLLSPLRPQDGSGAAPGHHHPDTLRPDRGPSGSGQGSGAAPLPGRDPRHAPDRDATDGSQRNNHQQRGPSPKNARAFQHSQPSHQPSTVNDKHDETGESARPIQHQPRQQQQQSHADCRGRQAPCPEQLAIVPGAFPRQAPGSRQGSDRDHAHDVLAARMTLLEGRVRFLEGEIPLYLDSGSPSSC